LDIKDLLKMTVERNASDLIIAAGAPPTLRIHGRLTYMDGPELTPGDTERLVFQILNEEQKRVFEDKLELDFSYPLPGVGRFRVNVHRQRGSVAVTLRNIPSKIPTIKELRLPPIVKEFARRPRGLVVVTGPTGSGKSTTQAALIDLINSERSCHIVTIEDPIEFLHQHKRSVIEQREVDCDTQSFHTAVRYALRQNADVILIGEVRDAETMEAAISAAETGHLVFATLHTSEVAQAVQRMIDMFEPHRQHQVRTTLAMCLEGIIAQRLIPRKDGNGRIVATEILVMTTALRNLIREGKIQQINAVLETGSKYGMHTMDQSIRKLYEDGLITDDDAIGNAVNPASLERAIKGNGAPWPGT